MKKWQKEILENELNSDKRILSELRQEYAQAEKEINAKIKALLSRSDASEEYVKNQVKFLTSKKGEITGILKNLKTKQYQSVNQYIKDSYEDGFIGTMYQLQKQGVPFVFPIDQRQVVKAMVKDSKLSSTLYNRLGVNITKLKNNINSELSRGIAEGKSAVEIARAIDMKSNIGLSNSMRIARTEGGRVRSEATLDSARKARDAGSDVVKRWDSTLDSKTRPHHQLLNGQTKELDEPFSVEGHEAEAPRMFGVPPEDINCRCSMLVLSRWASEQGSSMTKFDNLRKDGGRIVKLNDATSFADFKAKYKKAVDPKTSGVSLLDSISAIRDEIAKNGGIATEKNLKDAGREVMKDFNSKFDLKADDEKRKELRAELFKANRERDAYKGSDESIKKALEDKLIEADKAYRDFIDKNFTAKGKANKLTSVLSQIRDMGTGSLDIKGHMSMRSKSAPEILSAYKHYPTSWVDKSLKNGKLKILTVNRGYYSHSESTIAISGYSSESRLEVAFHELGHRFERTVPDVLKAEKAFYDRRTAGESLEWLGGGYAKSERTRKDNFIDAYMGKDYNETAYELVSMGFQYAFTDPMRLMADTDMAEWIYGILALL